MAANGPCEAKKAKIARACDRCRRKKIKCDGQYPMACSLCRAVAECTYNETEPKKLYKISYVEELEEKLAHCQDLLENQNGSVSRFDTLKRKQYSPPDPPGQGVIPSSDYCDLLDEELARNVNGLYIPTDDVKTGNRNLGKASMRGLFERITRYTGLKSEELVHRRRPEAWVEDWEKELTSSNTDSHKPPYVEGDFLNDTILNCLVDVYFKMVNVTFPLLNEAQFKASIPLRKLEREFGSVLMLVCALGALFSGDERLVPPGKEHLQFTAGLNFYKTARTKMKDFMLSAATLEDIQALILLQIYVSQGVHTKSSWMIHGLSICLARNLGLQHYWLNAHSESSEAEAGKRAMWMLYIIDRSHSSCFGRPLLLKDEEMSLEPLCSYGNEDIHGNISIVYVNELIKLCKIHGEVMQNVYKLRNSISDNEHKLTMADITCHHSKLNKWLSEMPDFLHISKTDSVPDFILQLRSNLRVCYYTINIFMYKPFLPNPTLSKPSSFQASSLLICASAARSIIGNYKEVLLKRNLNKFFVDCMIDWAPTWATLILIVACCETRRHNKAIDKDDVCYIKTGILVLRVNERKNVQYSRAIDVLLQVLKAVKLPNCEDFIALQENLSFNSSPESQRQSLSSQAATFALSDSACQQVSVEQDERIFGDMLEYMQNSDSMKDNLFGVDSLSSMPGSVQTIGDDDWSGIINPLLDIENFYA